MRDDAKNTISRIKLFVIMSEKKKRNKLFCGCKYAIDHYEDVEFCRYHTDFSQIANAVGNDARERLIKFIQENR